jgi:phosphatidate phosphatase APP1
MPTVFFDLMEFVRVNLLPQGRSLTEIYLVDNVIISLASRHTQKLRNIARRRLHFI